MLKNKATCLAKIPMKVHLTDDLKTNILISTDVLIPNNFVINCASQSATIDSYQNIQIQARSVIKPHIQVKRVITNKAPIIIAPGSVINVPISYYDTLPDNYNFLFKPELTTNLSYNEEVYAYIVDLSISFI